MKNTTRLWLLLLALIYSSGCEKKESAPLIKSTETKIGITGGNTATPSGNLTVAIPPGAFSQDVTIKIETITEVAPQGIGATLKLSPEGTKFLKPVTLTFKYDEAELTQKKTYPELLRVATREENGKWETLKKVKLDKVNKTISVEATHFSDWSLVIISGNLSYYFNNVQYNEEVIVLNEAKTFLQCITITPDGYATITPGAPYNQTIIRSQNESPLIALNFEIKNDLSTGVSFNQSGLGPNSCNDFQKDWAEIYSYFMDPPGSGLVYSIFNSREENGSSAIILTSWGKNTGDLIAGSFSGTLVNPYTTPLKEERSIVGEFAFVRQ
jgi:hypothetical protein